MGNRTLELILTEEIGRGKSNVRILSEVSKEIRGDELKQIVFERDFQLLNEVKRLSDLLDEQISESN